MRRGAATVVSLHADDRLTVRDLDGGQHAELTVLAASGGEDYQALGVTGDAAPATVLRGLVGSASDGAADVVGALGGRGLDPTRATAVGPVRACVAAGPRGDLSRGARLRWWSSAPPTESPSSKAASRRRTCSSRSARARAHDEVEPSLPEPLAEPRLDFQVDRASALAYEVKEGEYIQIIDVAGPPVLRLPGLRRARSCRPGWSEGSTRPPPGRSMGSMYPQPGLYSKFFTVDLEPLVEVVRDTVGRHDTFGLACTRKYYEDKGYFGHVNCSDNFNAQLDPYTVDAARRMAGDQLLLQHRLRRAQPVHPRRALVTPGRLRPAACHDRPRLPLERLPRRHRRGERVESDRGARPRLPGEGALQRGDRAPRDARRRAQADEGDGASTSARAR